MPPTKEPLAFWSKVDCGTDDECWQWLGVKSQLGYGVVRIKNSNYMAHRVGYELECGEIPIGYDIHHKCENPSCINPYHLIAITHQEHMNKYTPKSCITFQKQKTHCSRGHEFTVENIYITPQGYRNCRLCHRYYTRRYDMERKKNGEIW